MNKVDFNNLMNTRLGGNLIDVELSIKDYDAAFELAKLTYRQKGNDNLSYNFYAISVSSSVSEYTIPSEIDKIIKVIKPRSGQSGNSDDPFDIKVIQSIFEGLTFGVPYLVTYELLHQNLELLSLYAVDDIPFFHDRLNNKIKFLRLPKANEGWFLECYKKNTDDNYRDMLWIQEFTLAELKITLGRAYSKFSSISTPAGDIQLNGKDLIDEGKEDKNKLIADIANYVDSMEQHPPRIFMG